MSSLSISIAILVVVAIAAVVGVNLWQSGRLRRLGQGLRPRGPAAQTLEPTLGGAEPAAGAADDVRASPLYAERDLPDFDTQAGERGPSVVFPAGEADQPRASAAGLPAAAAMRAGDAASRQPPLSDVSDCIVELVLPGPQPGSRLLSQTRSIRLAGSKPILFEGASDDGSWRPLVGSGVYRRIRAGILLANRHGPLNAMEFSEFVAQLQPLSEALEALLDTPDMAPVLERARELDALCAELDAQVGVNVDLDEAIGVDDLARIASSLGMSERGNNRFARLGGDGELLFSLALGDAPNRLTFLLDVPRAPAAAGPFEQMISCARQCEQATGGRLVDDVGSGLGDEDFGHIGGQLAERYASLQAAGFPAGSGVALRLFN